jgi:hypothetical protein
MDETSISLYAGLALLAMMENDPDQARRWLLKIPRSKRGRVKIAWDDLDMILNRLGRDHA